MSTFSGLSVGLSSLFAQRRGLEVTGHNVANANTEGYSRQRVRLQAQGAAAVPAIHAQPVGAGNGVTVADTQRLRDAFLESRAVHERGNDAALRGTQTVLGRVEDIFAEPSANGIASQLAEFWSGWDDVANQPTDLAARSQLIERAHTLAGGINRASERLEVQWSASHEQLRAVTAEINSVAASVAQFNEAISSAVKAGLSPNDLFDQRDLLVQRLGELAGVTVRPGLAGAVTVFLGGTPLVSGAEAERLTVTGDPVMDPAGTSVVVRWAGDQAAVTSLGGTAGGLATALNDVLPRYERSLHDLAAALTTQVNQAHRAGYDQDGAAGGDVFRFEAGRLRVELTSPGQVAASSTPTPGGRNGANAAVLAELAGRPGGADESYRRLIVGLGVEAQAVNRHVDIQSNILGQVDAAREAEAGVSLDEEMTNLLAYQRAYEGAARFLTAVDSMLDTLINRTGLVGR